MHQRLTIIRLSGILMSGTTFKDGGSVKQGYHATLGAGGRVVIPACLRQTLHLKEGDPLVLETDGDAVRIASQETVLKEVQAFFRQGIPEGVSLVDELLAERRDEARREDEES